MADDASSEVEYDLCLNEVPAVALNVSSRMTLSWLLNPRHSVRCSSGYARDYRGLAELMNFDWNDIQNFERSDDPTSRILESWTSNFKHTIGMLIKFLKEMERFDVIEDCIEQFKKDGLAYLSRKNSEHPIQVPEVTSCRPMTSQSENPNSLTVSDAHSGGCTYYDAYVCYADEDLAFVWQLAEFLESSEVRLKLFIKDRDLLAGASEPDSHVRLIHERCDRMLIILSPEFLLSSACEFQTSFAAGLAMEQRQRKLIPIVIKPCNIPLILKYISKIDFTKPIVQSWLWDKLIQSIRGAPSSIFVSSANRSQTRHIMGGSLPEYGLPSTSNPMVTFPNSEYRPPFKLTSKLTENISTPDPDPNGLILDSMPILEHQGERVSPRERKRLLDKLREKFTSSSSTSSAAHASTTTSGYQSQSSFASGNNEFYT